MEIVLSSESATKLQQSNAKIMFGKNASKVLKALETYSKEKVLRTNGIKSVLAALKTKNTADLEKFASSKAGKTLASNCLKLANAKTPVALFAAIKPIKETSTLAKLAGVGAPVRAGSSPRTIKPGSSLDRPRSMRNTRNKKGVSVYIPDMQVEGLKPDGTFDSSADADELEIYSNYSVSFKPKKRGGFTVGTTVTAPSTRKLRDYLEDHVFLDDPASVTKHMKKAKSSS
jgi:hypothetical protein